MRWRNTSACFLSNSAAKTVKESMYINVYAAVVRVFIILPQILHR